MSLTVLTAGVVGFVIIVGLGLLSIPVVFADRVLPGVYVGSEHFGGIRYRDLPGVLTHYDAQLQRHIVRLRVRDHEVQHTLGELGVRVAVEETQQRVRAWRRRPVVISVAPTTFHEYVRSDFQGVVTPPTNATLVILPTQRLQLIKSQPGEGVDTTAFAQAVAQGVATGAWQHPITLRIIPSEASIQDHEVEAARVIAETVLRDGFTLTYNDQSWTIKPFTIGRMLAFQEQADPKRPSNQVLGVFLKPDEVAQYLTTTIAPEIDQAAHDARFEIIDDIFRQFTAAELGQALDQPGTIARINTVLAQGQFTTGLAVRTIEPAIADPIDIRSLGVVDRLAIGESYFSGSPANRIHNITVAVARYHGLLIPPDSEFSFNQFLGPVTAAAGFKPELVIKSNKTVPEFGGGVCQLSTTIFRAAIQAGVPITARRNHAYVVRYYGKPGFDATVYPPVTDLKWRNDTGAYVLVQMRIDGTRLYVELWGTPDGRVVALDGPHTYDRQPDGAVKAVLRRTVERGGAVLHDDTFYSRYRSPALFPKSTPPPVPPPAA